jgi:small nuclear ribonucleoprotein (snRNP)-like protein
MAANDKQVKIVKKDGKKYRITATQNKFHIEQLEGPNKGEFAELIFNPEEQTWSLKDGNKALQKLVNLNEETQTVTVYKPNGEYIQADLNETNLFTLRHQLNQQQRMYSMQ